MNAPKLCPLYPNIKKTITITSFSCEVIALKLFEWVSVCAKLYDADGRLIECRNFRIEQPDYDEWADDKFITKYIQKQLQADALVA